MSEQTDNDQAASSGTDNPAVPQRNAPSAEDINELMAWIARELHELHFRGNRDWHTPDGWPHLAAVLQVAGTRLLDAGAQLAASLAAYTEAHPTVEVPDDGPAVFLLQDREHDLFWREANTAEPLQHIEDPARRYAEAFTVQHGRPDLGYTATALDAQRAGNIMIQQYIAVLGPAAVVRVYFGGQLDEHQIAAVLYQHGLTVGERRFLPPLWPDGTVITVPGCADTFDAYGRVLDQTVPS